MIHDPQHPINQLPAWLQADHWTRHLLLGRGIVCRFNMQTLDDCTFRLCGGTGVTSDGTLVTSPKKDYHFTHYWRIETPDYPFFQNEEGEPYDLWEVLEGRPDDPDAVAFPLTPQNEDEEINLFLRNKVMIAYLDDMPGNPNPPIPADIPLTHVPEDDVDGTPPMVASEIAYGIRWLLMRQADVISALGLAERVTNLVAARGDDDDYTYSEAYSDADEQVYETDVYRAADARLEWPEIPLRRFGWGCIDPFDCDPEDLDNSEFPHIQDLDEIYRQYVCIINAATKALDREANRMQHWLAEHFYCFTNENWEEWLSQLCRKWEAFKELNQLSDTSRHRKEHVQYFYDWCRDLLAAYHELRREVLDWRAECCPDPTSHPRHLLLGLVMRGPNPYYPAPLRHHYLQPPVFNEMAERAQRIRLYHERFLLAIREFYLPYSIPDDAINPFCHHEEAGEEEELPGMTEIKVTPGRYYDQPLGSQSIPYYYPLSEGRFSIHRFWEAFRSRTLRIDHHRSYHARMEDGSYSQLPRTTHPLRYNIDTDEFFRIEGHIRSDLATVRVKLNKWRRKHNLAFDVIYRRVDDLTDENVLIDAETFNTFQKELSGAEHLAGVMAGGTFIVVYDNDDMVIADFSLPYRCCHEEVVLPPTEVAISGQVVSCTGEPLPGAAIQISGIGPQVIADSSGNFATSLLAGDYRLSVSVAAYETTEVNISIDGSAPAENIGTITLRPVLINIVGQINFGPQTVIPTYTIVVLTADGTELTTQSDTTGAFQFNDVARDFRQILLRGGDSETIVQVPAGEICETLTLSIDPPSSNQNVGVTGQILDCHQEPLVGVTIMLVGTTIGTVTDFDGNFALTLPAGNHELTLGYTGYSTVSITVDADGSSPTVDLGTTVLEPILITLHGRVHRSGIPLPNQTLVIITEAGEELTGTSSVTGSFQIDNVPRSVNQITHRVNGQETVFPIVEDINCDQRFVDIDRSQQVGGVINDFRAVAFTPEGFYESMSVASGSEDARALEAFYDERFAHYTSAYNTASTDAAITNTASIDVVTNSLNRIVNEPDASTVQVHNAYKAAVRALDSDLANATATEKTALLKVADSVNKLYLYRVALMQSSQVTTGTTNALKLANTIGGGAIDMEKTTLEWTEEAKGRVVGNVLTGIRAFNT